MEESDNSVTKNSDIQTYPINDMLKNFEFITRVYNLLNEHVKLKINIHPAGEWLLDNYYIIEENVKSVQKELSLNKYKNLQWLCTYICVGLRNFSFYRKQCG